MEAVPMPEQKSESLMLKRAKAWKELSDAEKIERMHEVIKSQVRELDRCQSEIRKLRSHTHDRNGDLLVPYSHHDGGYGELAQCSPESGPWF